MYEDPKSKISQLEKVLDSRENKVFRKAKRHELHDQNIVVNQDWDDNEFRVGEEIFSSPEKPQGLSFPMKILIGSAIFFILALGIAAFKFLGGGNMVSGDNIDVTVKAPISVTGGEILPFEIEIRNNNNTTLSGVDMGITFPTGSRQADNISLPANRIQEYIGNISPGQVVKKNLAVVLFGSENEKKDISISLEYRITGSNSLFNKNKIVSVLISSAPVNIVVTGPQEVNTNQTVNYKVEVTSNSPTIIKDLLLKADYPFGFSFINSVPNYYSKNNLWLIGDLEPGAKRTIMISGILNGQEGEERSFDFSLGAQSASDSQAIGVEFTSYLAAITIRRPFVSADIYFNGNDVDEYVIGSGEKIETVIRWQNNLPYEVSDVSITAKITGNDVNKASIQVEGGFYRSIDNTIIFNKNTNSVFANLSPGQTGESKFSLSSFSSNSVTGSILSNPTINLEISVKGRRVDFQGGQENVLFSDTRKIKITSDPKLYAKALYSIGPFQNTGPIPPKAEQKTTYTVTWTVTNPLNNLSNARVSAVLPTYVEWLSSVSPDRERVDYNEDTGQVIWTIGNISAGAGIVSPAKEVSFRISFLPSVSQIGISPDLIGAATLTAKDNFTLVEVSNNFQGLNTRLTSDPNFDPNDDIVLQ